MFLSMAMTSSAFAQQNNAKPGFTANTPMVIEKEGSVLVDGKRVPLSTVKEQDMGYFLPDGKGGLIWSQSGEPRPEVNKSYMDAREIKLQVRELAEQLLANITQFELRGKIALPTSFVNQDNFEESSAFGRYIAEQMFHEFNQRGFEVREYRLSGQNIRMREGEGDFYLSRAKGKVTALDRANVVLVGTYYHDDKNVFINARLIRPSDGYVYRTGQMVMPITGTTRTMLAKSGRRLESGSMNIVSRDAVNAEKARLNRTRNPQAGSGEGAVPGGADISVLDKGYDIH